MPEAAQSTLPLVSVVLLSWNGEKHIHRCLQHVLEQKYTAVEIILVDNASTDASIERIRAAHPGLHLILNKENRGFAAGMNQGIEASRGEYVVLLNQDVCLHPDFISECVSRIRTEEGLGAIGGRVFAWIGDDLTGELRRGEGELTYLRKRIQGFCGIRSDSEAYVFMPTGSFPFVSRRMLEDLKEVSGCYYDEDFGTGWEDIDLFLRMQLRAWRCVFLPQARGWHVGSGSVEGKDTFLAKKNDYQKRIIRNRHSVIIKDLPFWTIARLFPYLVFAELAMLPYLLLLSPRSVSAWAAAWGETLAGFGGLLEKRRRIQSSARVGNRDLKTLFRGI